MITITPEAYNSVLAQAQGDVPNESCGYLLGTDKETVTENYPMTNIDHSPEHFSFDPKEQFAAIKYACSKGLVVFLYLFLIIEILSKDFILYGKYTNTEYLCLVKKIKKKKK